jgi:hypothetical protein
MHRPRISALPGGSSQNIPAAHEKMEANFAQVGGPVATPGH